MTTRRNLLMALPALVLGGCALYRSHGPEHGPIAALFPGRIDDGGFMESGYRGLMRVEEELKIPVRYVDNIPPERERMLEALRALARSDATLVIAHGGQASDAIQRVAWEFPEQHFVCIQGNRLRPNLSVYEVLQEQSTWLAGALAGLVTRTGVVGHMSGLRVPPGLKARAAFADGLKATRPEARLLTNFSGDQDDAELARRVAMAEIDAGADVIYTMLNAGRAGAIEACRQRGVKQIGNVRDWVAAMPEVFIGAAVADVGYALYTAVVDLRDNMFRGDFVRRFGLRDPQAVRLSIAESVPQSARLRLEDYRTQIVTGRVNIPEIYAGPEFTVA